MELQTWAVVDNVTNKIICITQETLGEIAIATAANVEGHFVVEMGNTPTKDLYYKKYIDGELVDDPEARALGEEAEARDHRDMLLREEVDPLVTNPLRWADLTEEQQAAWTAYRTALLNVPQQDGFPQNIDWPEKP